ncbi:DUF2513 domain-containing protein [Roseovarius pelagicus]|uniref:DUF2513 domain-containing protein n=1 Tax=Roseovarius pelagicus TaxID=2980108 RepID=A0ABY6DEU1_9RHOB|nr:DUF2513 domain-containing protein [Roseovarius pelagicus]UXX84671.1 DUF2513 domain-containing protein [Roseovarius pelagicus]
MKRDQDFIRQLLLKYEAEDDWVLMTVGDIFGSSEEERRENYHMHLMMDEGFLTPIGNGTFRITSYGHDYLEAIRDDTVWAKTKRGALSAGGASLRLMFEIASSIVKQKAAEALGLPL